VSMMVSLRRNNYALPPATAQFVYALSPGLDTVCGILEVKVHSSSFGGILVGISHSTHPPFESRTAVHRIIFNLCKMTKML
jgi:hypothetical protein